MPAEEKDKIIATREGQVAKGIYGFGARVAALLGPNPSPELKTEVQRVLRATQPRGFMHGVKLGMVNGYSPEEVGASCDHAGAADSGTHDKVNPGDKNAAVLIKFLKNGKLEWLENTATCRRSKRPTPSTRCCAISSDEERHALPEAARACRRAAWRHCPGAGASFPSRPVTLIVPFAAGGSTDVIARVVAEAMRGAARPERS